MKEQSKVEIVEKTLIIDGSHCIGHSNLNNIPEIREYKDPEIITHGHPDKPPKTDH